MSGPTSIPSRPMSVTTNTAAVGKQPERIVEHQVRSPRSSRAPPPRRHDDRDRRPRARSPTPRRRAPVHERPPNPSRHGPLRHRRAREHRRATAPRRRSAPRADARERRGDRRDDRPVDRVTRPGGVEVDDVHPRRAGCGELARDRHRVVAVDRLVRRSRPGGAARRDRRAGRSPDRARSAHRAHLDEVGEQPEARTARLLGMELHGEHVVARGTRR